MNIREFIENDREANERSFGKFVRQRREELGLTVRGMAARLDMTPAYLSDIEKGNRYAPIKYMGKLCEILQIPTDDAREFEDLASATRGNRYEDINPYLGKQPLARAALRKARDINLSDEQWKAFIKRMDYEKSKRSKEIHTDD